MSTAHSFNDLENTLDVYEAGENNSYRYGSENTDIDTEETPRIEPRSAKVVEKSFANENRVEIIKQRWNGVVVSTDENEITVLLEDSTDPSKPDEQVVLSLEEIEPRDRPLVAPGAMFVWHIGYREGPKYPRERFSKIVFRRLINWTQREINEAEALTQEYTDFFLPNNNGTASA